MPLYRMSLAYDGTSYRGWQVQRDADTIQGRLQEALSTLAGTSVGVVGAGRTDAGVHAVAQVAHFRLPRPIPEEGIEKALNSLLPPDIRVSSVAPADAAFHARKSARWKTYRYHIDRARVASPFRCRFAFHYPRELDVEALDEAAAQVVGEHDFAGFRASGAGARTSRRRVTVSRFLEDGGELVYEITADGFLYHMVRNLVGTLIEIGRHKRPAGAVAELLQSKRRADAGPTAAAKGLHLLRVEY